MMKPEKLSQEQLRHVEVALREIGQMCSWEQTAGGHDYWMRVCHQLKAMWDNKTTDGKPWTESEPPIPDGYRRAVKGDVDRQDVQWWNPETAKFQDCGPWSAGFPFASDRFYIVPVDRTPTDDDAKSRPVVMVRDHNGQDWTKRVLLGVLSRAHYRFVTTCSEETGSNSWKHCRFPYSNETP